MSDNGASIGYVSGNPNPKKALRQPVRLGRHGDQAVFDAAKGLHDPVMGLAVVGVTGGEPEVLFEEHGIGIPCEYFQFLSDPYLAPGMGPTEPLADIEKQITSDDLRMHLHAVKAAFMLEPAERVNQRLDELRERYVPEGGGVFLLRVVHRFQRRKAMIRVLRAIQAKPSADLELVVSETHPLQTHEGGGEFSFDYLYVPIALLSSPAATGVVAFRVIREKSETLLLFLAYGYDKGILLRDAEVTWRGLYEAGLPQYKKAARRETARLQVLNGPAGRLPPHLLLGWWTDQLNHLFTELTDLGRFRAPDGLLDARRAYRELRTIDRAFEACVRIQARPEDHAVRLRAAFEFFDLLPNALDRELTAREVYAALVNPDVAATTLDRVFSSAPSEVAQVLRDRSRRVTAELKDETLEQVVSGRRSGDSVSVGDENARQVPGGEYVAAILRELRNTVHGYELNRPDARLLLDSHSGHISILFPELAVLWLLALVAAPGPAIAGEWFRTTASEDRS